MWRLKTVRARTTIAVAAITAAAILIGIVAVTAVLSRSLVSGLDDTLLTQVLDRARLIDGGADPATLTTIQQDELFVWIADADGTVIAEGGHLPDVNIADAVATLGTDFTGDVAEGGDDLGDEPLRFAVAHSQDGVVVVSGSETEEALETARNVQRLLLAGAGPFVLLVAALAWVAIGRALRPVEEIRRQTESISATALHERLPEPGTGDEIARLAETMNAMLGRLDAAAGQQRRFVTDASHELRTPLASVRALVETSEMSGDDKSITTDEIDRLVRLVDDLLVLSAGSEDQERASVTVDLDEIAFNEAELLRRRTDLTVDITHIEPVQIKGDSGRLHQAVTNLVANASRHARSQVAISVTTTNDTAVIAVDDDGDGVPDGERNAIFDRFARTDASRSRASGGSGLGLAIVAQIVEAHDGTVEVTDSGLGGARFTITFPVG